MQLKNMRVKDMVKVAAAFTKAGRSRRQYWLGAIGIRKDGAMVMARNEASAGPDPHVHAEARLTKKLGMDAPMVLVVRTLKNGELAMAKPCPYCESILKSHRVKKIFYTTDDGIEQLR